MVIVSDGTCATCQTQVGTRLYRMTRLNIVFCDDCALRKVVTDGGTRELRLQAVTVEHFAHLTVPQVSATPAI